MKNTKYFFIFQIVLLLGIFSVGAQSEFAPIGAEWFYNYEWGTIYIPGEDPVIDCHLYHVISEKDTMIDENNCRVLKQFYDNFETIDAEYILKQKQGKVYYYYKEQFNLLFDFDVKINDTVSFTFMYKYANDTFTYKDTILSARYKIEDITINAQNIRTFKTKILAEDVVEDNGMLVTMSTYYYTEKLGFNERFMPLLDNVPHPDVDNFELLRCYSDSDISHISNWWKEQSLPCDYYYSHNVSIYLYEKKENIRIYPNPTKNLIHIEYLDILDIHAISLINMQGQIVRSYEPNTTQLDVSDIMGGIYFIRLSSSKGDVVEKIVINK